jgi:hypothetical protein
VSLTAAAGKRNHRGVHLPRRGARVSGYNEVIEVAKKLDFDIYGVFMKPFDPDARAWHIQMKNVYLFAQRDTNG